MKILVFEYITGGGLRNESLPASLAGEGGLMITALLKDLLAIGSIELWVTRDWRLPFPENLLQFPNLNIIEVNENHDLDSILLEMIDQCDAVWPIAPETDNKLANLCEMVEGSGKHLLSSSSKAVTIAGNKIKTFQRLKEHNIPAVPTHDLDIAPDFKRGEWVFKPVDGIGCEGIRLIGNEEEFKRCEVDSAYIMQPYVQGNTVSLSCLFKQGRGWLICGNEQKVEQVNGKFFLRACIVNISRKHRDYQVLIDLIAQAIPGLWGYAGIDLIETGQGAQVLEVNPRLTTSYAGICEATGINTAKTVLGLLKGTPELEMISDKHVTITIPQGNDHAG